MERCIICDSTNNVSLYKWDWLRTPRLKYKINYEWTTFEAFVCEKCHEKYGNNCTIGRDWWDALDELDHETTCTEHANAEKFAIDYLARLEQDPLKIFPIENRKYIL